MKDIDEEITPDEIGLDSFKLKSSLNSRFWDSDLHLDQNIRRALLVIAKEFIDEYGLGDFEIEDVIITGSIANYNWSEEYSDVDLHIVMDITELADDKAIAKTLCDSIRNVWNKAHTDISVGGFPVEIYIQDSHEPHKSSGVYSILNDEWLIEPSLDDLKPKYNDDDVKSKVSLYMNLIDTLEEKSKVADPGKVYTLACNAMDCIKAERANSMKTSGAAELTTGNVIFKTLRRNGYIEKLINLKLKCFDEAHSIQ